MTDTKARLDNKPQHLKEICEKKKKERNRKQSSPCSHQQPYWKCMITHSLIFKYTTDRLEDEYPTQVIAAEKYLSTSKVEIKVRRMQNELKDHLMHICKWI